MAHVYKEFHHKPERREGDEYIERSVDNPDKPILRVQSLVYTLVGLLEGLLAIRFIFALLGANANNGFANFIYNVTQPFVSPFQGLFNYDFQAGISRFEIETVVAMIVYALVGWLFISLMQIGKRDPEV